VYVIQNTLHVASDGGRVCRPLIICDAGVPRVKNEHTQALKVTPPKKNQNFEIN
jgi:DNA-directed RNA polymerase III subunit RPC2